MHLFIELLCRRMDQLRPIPAAQHLARASFVHRELKDSAHVFLHQDSIRVPWSHPTTAHTE
jgi:hypothetical protein